MGNKKQKKIFKAMMSLILAFVLLLSYVDPRFSEVEAAAAVPSIEYQAHVSNKGWLSAVKNGAVAGTTGQSLGMEALIIKLSSNGKSMITYRAHVRNIGWQNWVTSGRMAGTTGKALPMEAIQIKLTEGYANKYDIYYRIHSQSYGWLGWAKNGEIAGTTGGALRAEAIQIKLVKKGEAFNRGGTAYHQIVGTRQINLKHHMNCSLKQPYSGPCCAYAYAIGLSIVTGNSYNPMQFYRGGLAYYDYGKVGAYKDVGQYSTEDIYNALKKGRPTMLNYRHSGGEHWVIITGIRAGVNPKKISYGDFYCIDPVTGSEVRVSSAYRFNDRNVLGIKMF